MQSSFLVWIWPPPYEIIRPMAKLAYLGPEWTFSHDLAKAIFPEHEHMPQDSLESVVESVSTGECTIGLIPFYNTTRLSIEESQIALVKHKGKAFVTDVLPLDVKHHVGGFGTLATSKEFRSKSVVFHQISKWLDKRGFATIAKRDYSSTSAAVKSLIEDQKPKHCACIGTASAFRNYHVPVFERRIQNEPNVTLFFVLGKNMPDVAISKRVLMCLTNPTTDDKRKVEEAVLRRGCNISSNWEVNLKERPAKKAYFFEIDGSYSSLGLGSAVSELRTKGAFVLGGYADKCITRLIWPKE